MSDDATSKFVQLATARFIEFIPHARALGIEITGLEGVDVLARMPMRPEFIGDIDRGVVHTGVVTSFIDSICGLAVYVKIGAPDTIATLDLRVDYLRPSLPQGELRCRAECYRLSEQIAFVKCVVWQTDEAQPVASSLATFMRGQSGRGAFQ